MLRLHCSLLILCCAVSTARAASLSFTGSLDPTNPNDVFLATFQVSAVSGVVIQSYGYGGSADAAGGTNAAGAAIAAGGFDTYFSLFSGTGNGATFLDSNDDGGCTPAAPVNGYCEDSRLVETLAAGSYTLALTLPENYSFAENYGSGDLGDGFIGLQGDYYDANSGIVRTAAFAFDITGADVTAGSGGGTGPGTGVTPEPSTLVQLATGAAAILGVVRRGRGVSRSLTR